jgi:hypothetical protein
MTATSLPQHAAGLSYAYIRLSRPDFVVTISLATLPTIPPACRQVDIGRMAPVLARLLLCQWLCLLFAHLQAAAFPVEVANCGVTHRYTKAPSRAVTLNQGATEVMLALGLESAMVATAYLDDEISSDYKAAYSKVRM